MSEANTDPINNANTISIASHWLSMIRFSHTIFALPFAILAAFLAWSTPLRSLDDTILGVPDGYMAFDVTRYPPVHWQHIVGVLLCMVFARSAAMAFNRLVDHRVDAENPRTQSRHLPAGILSRRSVALFTMICSIGFVGSTGLFWPNRLPLALSLPVLGFLCGYSLAKRFTASAHLWLGVALSLAPICVWVAIRGENSLGETGVWNVPLLLAGSVACWVAGFDILYACQDAEFDSKAGLHSVPARFGVRGALRIAAGFHVVMLGLLFCLAASGDASGLGAIFWVACMATAGLVIAQHWMVSADDLSRVNQAFFHTNAIVSVLLLVAGVVDCYV